MADRDSEPLASGITERERDDDTDSIATERILESGSERCMDDGWETCDSDSDTSIPDPDEIMLMPNSGPLFDWERVSKVLNGPICWKCLLWSPYFCCEKCGRRFHRECVLMDAGFPDPIFDKSLNEACMANYDEVKLVKCAICIISEETQIRKFREMSQQKLNDILLLIGRYIHAQFGIDVLPEIEVEGITTSEIQEKASRGEYGTIEGFYNDYKLIQYNIIKKYARESEQNDVAKTVLNTVELYMHVMLSCVDCVNNYFDSEGRPHSARDFSHVLREPCSEPHGVLWIKEWSFPFWPAKMLAHDPVKKRILIVFFGERAVAKLFPYPCDEIVCQTYSSVFPDRKPKKSENKWAQAYMECKGYIKNLREIFGEEGVVVPQNSVEFGGDLEAYERFMFPKYEFENKRAGGVPDHNL